MSKKKPTPGSSAKKKPAVSLVRSSAAEYLTFVAASGQGGVEAVYADENVWLSQKMIGVLYDVETHTINYHLKKIFADSELEEGAVIRNFRITATDGKNYQTKDNRPGFVLANSPDRSGYSNQSGDCPARSAMKTPKATPHSLPRQRDPVLRQRALIKADFGPEHADTLRRDLHPDLRADTATRVSAKPKPRSQLAGLLRSERQLLANPPFNGSDTALRGSASLQSEAKPQVMSEAKDNFRKDDDVRWQWSGATWTTEGCPQGERGGVHQFGVPPKGNANFACVQHFIHHLARPTATAPNPASSPPCATRCCRSC